MHEWNIYKEDLCDSSRSRTETQALRRSLLKNISNS